MKDFFRNQAMGANKRTRTRGLLLDSAIDVFSEKGIQEASINEITAIAGLANGTFYNHFKDKDELALASAEAITLEIAKQMDEQMADLDRGISRVIVGSWAFILIAVKAGAWAHVLVSQYQRSPFTSSEAFQYMRADIEKAVEQGDLDVTVDDFLLEQVAALVGATLRRLLDEVKPDEEKLDRTCQHILRLLGLTPTQAKHEVDKISGYPLLLNLTQ